MMFFYVLIGEHLPERKSRKVGRSLMEWQIPGTWITHTCSDNLLQLQNGINLTYSIWAFSRRVESRRFPFSPATQKNISNLISLRKIKLPAAASTGCEYQNLSNRNIGIIITATDMTQQHVKIRDNSFFGDLIIVLMTFELFSTDLTNDVIINWLRENYKVLIYIINTIVQT